ncbi:EAL domain-containing protein [Burkholderia sp. 4701]|nr:EAL domain-containing protein [Burkholderia sp. 4701]MXN83989.1 EAL domain-containing protein [Burkholderia sp. 4812]
MESEAILVERQNDPHEIAIDAERGLDENEFFLVFQPKLRLETGLLSGFESLIRWRHPIYGVLMPSAFIDTIENSPLSCRFTDFLLTEAARTLANWGARGYGNLSLSINLPAHEITQPGMADMLSAILDTHAVGADNLQIELTESTDPGPIDTLSTAVASLREAGVSVAIDDFGSGCWSLTILHRLAVDTLKLDRSFIGNIHESSEARAVVEALVRLGQRLGKRIVVEGVETEAQLAWARTMTQIDCQGYYISAPVQDAQINGLVAKHGVPKTAQDLD